MRFLKLDTVIDDYIDWTGHQGRLDRVAMKKWGNSVLRKLEVPDIHDDKIVILEVKDHVAVAPDDVHSMVQIAFKNESSQKVKRVEIVEWVQKMYDGSGCELIITKDCPRCHKTTTDCQCDSPEVIYNVDRLWELSHPEFKYGHMKHYYRHGGLGNDNQVLSPYSPEFVIMKPATHDFFNADSFIPGCLNLNKKLLVNNKYTFKYNHPTIRVNQEKGKILLSYLAIRQDENGYRMVPDVEEVFDAIKWHIIEAMAYRSIGKSTNSSERNHWKSMYADAKQNRLESMGAAFEVLDHPDFKSWWDFLEQNHFKVLKDYNQIDYFDVKTPDQFGQTMDRLTRHR